MIMRSLDHFEVIREGSLSEDEYERVIRDITNFLEYIGEPIQLERRALGVRVIAFLLIFPGDFVHAETGSLEGRPLVLHQLDRAIGLSSGPGPLFSHIPCLKGAVFDCNC